MLEFTPEQQAAIEAACAQHLQDCRNYPKSPNSSDGPAVPEDRKPASVMGEPSDEEIMGLMPQQMHEDLADAVRAMAEREGIDSTAAKAVMRIILNRHVVDLARAVLVRWGNPAPQPPAEGEAAELVEWLGVVSEQFRLAELDSEAVKTDRAAELLQRLSPPQPVPVSERLPGDALCWWYEPDEEDGYGGQWTLLRIRGGVSTYTHWLPAHALPLPEQEVSE